MKKLILSVTAIAGLAMAGSAQQVLFHDSNIADASSSNDITINGVTSTGDLNLELLVGSSAGAVTTDVVTLLLSLAVATPTTAAGTVQPGLGDISTAGVIDDLTQNAYSVPAGTDFYQILAWSGAYSSYAAALASGAQGVNAGESSVLAFDSQPASGSPAVQIDLPSAINLTQVPTSVVPEPSTMAMAGVGLASMLIFRRRNK
jgi:hypothetical protein